VAAEEALKLRFLDLLVVAGTAIAALWAGQAAGPHLADHFYIHHPVPDVAIQAHYDVTSTKDDITALEDQQQVVDYEAAFSQVQVYADQASLSGASVADAKAMRMAIGENKQLLKQLGSQREKLSADLDAANETLAIDEYQAQEQVSWSASLRRAGEWGYTAAASLVTLLALSLLLLLPPFRRVLQRRLVVIGALILLMVLLITMYAEWVGLLLIAVGILLVIALFTRGRKIA
jgi:hypothetical protein